MFVMGVVFLLIGAVFVYESKYIISKIKKGALKNLLIIKFIGIGIAILGFFMILYGEFPDRLTFLRIL